MANAQHFDVLIIGAGISGISMACQLIQSAPANAFPSSNGATPSEVPGIYSVIPASALTRT